MIEGLILLLVLLYKAQNKTPGERAADSKQKAADASAAAAAAAASGDHATAAEKQKEAAEHRRDVQVLTKSARTPPPWPQALPPDLPPFPSGWTPASPVTSAMVSRAFALLPDLWAHGELTWKPEKTGDRWVVYQARSMAGGKRGVVAFTTIQQAATQPAAFRRAPAPVVTPGAPLPTTVPASSHAPVPAAASSQPLQTVRLTSPRMQGPSIVWLQQRLGIGADGVYGPGSQAAVIAFQRSHGLTADGVVGPQTWAALRGGAAQAA